MALLRMCAHNRCAAPQGRLPARSGADLSASREDIEGADAPAGTRMNENDFIAALRKLPLHDGARGLDDDCAVLELGSETLILTHDAMARGTHYFPDADPYDVAWKLVASNLSDLAAKGAEPIGVLLGYSLGGDDARFLEGLHAVLAQYQVPLLGGDTIAAPDSGSNGQAGTQTLGLTAIGRATHTPVPSRSGANVGDTIYLCGVIGDAMAGYDELTKLRKSREMGLEEAPSNSEPDPYFVEKFVRPTPLLQEGQELVPLVSAMMDVSDGLFLDAKRLAEASNVTLDIAIDTVPHSPQFQGRAKDGNQLDERSEGWPERMRACGWGDDYALLFTAAPTATLPSYAKPIGTVCKFVGERLLLDGKPISPDRALGYQHG